MSSNRKKKNDEGGSGSGSDEVEQLLQSAQDEMLLKLSVNSHIAHISSNYLDSDLDRRFQALKSRPSLPQSSPSPSSSSSSSYSQSNHRVNNVNVNVDDELKSVLGDDLSARFAALKASSSSSSNDNKNPNGLSVDPNISHADDDDEEDEVEKLIRWAKDAARLDPSPPSDDDNDDKDSDCDDSDDDYKDSDDDEPRLKKDHRK